MATFPQSGICKWDTNGDLICKEQFANMAKLGEKCNDATCEDGICFRDKDTDENSYCKYVLSKGKYGCDKEDDTVCSKGLTCVRNKCVFGKDDEDDNKAEKKDDTTKNNDNQWDLDKISKIVMIIVGSIVGVLLIVLIIVLLVRSTQRPSTSY
jgi:hypothetical protein